MSSPASSHRRFDWRRRKLESAIFVLVVAVPFVLLIPVLIPSIFTERRQVCKGHLKQISQALAQYAERYGSFPPAYTVGASGQKLHSWRSLILPFLNHGDLYSQIRWNEPWNGPHNRRLSEQTLDVYTCPSASSSNPGRTNYFAIVDRATAWPEQYAVRIRDIRDGISMTIQLIEADLHNVNWMEPRDVSRKEAIEWIEGKANRPPSHRGITNVGMCDGTVMGIRTTVIRMTLNSLTSINSGAPFPGVDWPATAEEAEREFPAPRLASDLTRSEVWPVTDCEIVSGRNIVYCCSFQMAWDHARGSVDGAEIELEGDPPLAVQLNSASFPTTDLSANCYVAVAGPGSVAVPMIQQQLRQRFPGFEPRLHEDADRRRFVAYAYLRKALPFAVSFDRLTEPLLFNTTRVASFGVAEFDADDARHVQFSPQLKVLDYVSDDDFVIRLIPRKGTDEIVLAKVAPDRTLAETLTRVLSRTESSSLPASQSELASGESLVVPVLAANIQRDYTEIKDLQLKTPTLRDLFVADVSQVIQFRLDETGARLESESVIIADDVGATPKPPHPRKFILDRPFLIWLRETTATQPYFAAWIENPEFMEVSGQ